MGLVLGERAKDATPAAHARMAKGVTPEEEAEIQEIERPAEDAVNPQRVYATRRHDDEWAVYEEDHLGKAIQKLQRTVEDLMGQIEVSEP